MNDCLAEGQANVNYLHPLLNLFRALTVLTLVPVIKLNLHFIMLLILGQQIRN